MYINGATDDLLPYIKRHVSWTSVHVADGKMHVKYEDGSICRITANREQINISNIENADNLGDAQHSPLNTVFYFNKNTDDIKDIINFTVGLPCFDCVYSLDQTLIIKFSACSYHWYVMMDNNKHRYKVIELDVYGILISDYKVYDNEFHVYYRNKGAKVRVTGISWKEYQKNMLHGFNQMYSPKDADNISAKYLRLLMTAPMKISRRSPTDICVRCIND